MNSEKVIQPENIPPIPPVMRARLPWYKTIVHTIRIWYLLQLQRLKLGILSWLGVDQLLQNEANARKANDATALGLIQRHATQVNRIAQQLPALVAAKKRVEFYEQPSEYLNHAKRRYDKAHPKLTLEKSNGKKADGQAQRDGGRSGAADEVPESPRSDVAREAGNPGLQRATDDGSVEGRPEVQGESPTRQQIIGEMMDSDEAASFTPQHRIPTDDDERHEYEPGSGSKCRLCGMSENNIMHRPPNPLISDPNDR